MEKYIVENKKVFDYKKKEKNSFFKKNFLEIIKFHQKNCKDYFSILKNLSFQLNKKIKITDIPPIPVSIFKDNKLYSCNEKKIIKKLLSSGTTGNKQSQIFLDAVNSKVQTKVLVQIMEYFFGKKRMPMLIIDKKFEYKDRTKLLASQAAVNGFSILAKKTYFALHSNGQINLEEIKKFMEEFADEEKIVFGFTNKVFEFFLEKQNLFKDMQFKNCMLLHGGGWKKIESKSMSPKKFKSELKKRYNFKKILNYYGLIEQTGSIFVECNKCDSFKCSIYSDVYVRDENLKIEQQHNKKGLIQLMSLLPSSYPGNNILTEDLGLICSSKTCKCNFKGKRFKIIGRSKESEVRGCANI